MSNRDCDRVYLGFLKNSYGKGLLKLNPNRNQPRRSRV
ncbi:hypothetical protein CKA32_006719 [Geitlerinema sp. FC II]|nr:hypothetical protein CKA32_006719 [Geitlerinema sp. FC II]